MMRRGVSMMRVASNQRLISKSYRLYSHKVVLKGERDVFNGISIDLGATPFHTLPEFESVLKHSLQEYKKEHVRGLWLKIPIEKSHLIPAAVANGFVFHHTEPDFVMMTNWLCDSPNKLPRFPQHFVGCGGLTVDWDKREVLLITEKTKFRHEDDIMWKIPGGQCDDPNESLGDAAVREVWEETGVKTEFVSLLGFRHMHSFRFGKSDLYFIALLKPLTKEINLDPEEIEFCEWIPLDKYFSFTHLYKVQMEAMKCLKRYEEDGTIQLKAHDVSQFNRKSTMYTVE